MVEEHPTANGKKATHQRSRFATTEYARTTRVLASEVVKAAIQSIGIHKCARESGFHRANVIRKLVRGLPIKRVSYTEFVGWLRDYESTIAA